MGLGVQSTTETGWPGADAGQILRAGLEGDLLRGQGRHPAGLLCP